MFWIIFTVVLIQFLWCPAFSSSDDAFINNLPQLTGADIGRLQLMMEIKDLKDQLQSKQDEVEQNKIMHQKELDAKMMEMGQNYVALINEKEGIINALRRDVVTSTNGCKALYADVHRLKSLNQQHSVQLQQRDETINELRTANANLRCVTQAHDTLINQQKRKINELWSENQKLKDRTRECIDKQWAINALKEESVDHKFRGSAVKRTVLETEGKLWSFRDGIDRMNSLLSKPVSIARNAAIFDLQRELIHNDRYAKKWRHVFRRALIGTDILSDANEQSILEMEVVDWTHQHREKMASIQRQVELEVEKSMIEFISTRLPKG